MKILYLYTELMGYNIPVLNELVSCYGAKIHVISWDTRKLTPYEAPNISGVTFLKRSDFDKHSILKHALDFKPDLVYVPNWYDKGYLLTCKKMRSLGVPVVAGLDNQWRNTIKQWAGCVLMRLTLKNYFSHLWVSGPFQFEFARRLGFKKENILFDFYSADVTAFAKAKTKNELPKRFLFVGRLENEKGIDILLKAWDSIKIKKGWDLTLIGNGSLKSLYSNRADIILKDFLQPDELIEEINNYGCFVLPSRYEPYGVVLHEFAAAGMPLIASDCCGAAPIFVRSGFNGFQFKNGSDDDLASKLKKIIHMSDHDLKTLGDRSIQRSLVITPQTSAASLMSVLN